MFSNLVYDRVGGGSVYRLMPDPLDVAFAALGNNQAAELLQPELQTYDYAPDLASMRVLVDAHPTEFWEENLYNHWLGAIRSLSPDDAALSDQDSGLSPAMRSSDWGLRLLSTELASWAELRHDTILYAKQSYTAGLTCEFPSAYVDPYPEFYRKVGAYAEFGRELAAELGEAGGDAATLGQMVEEYFGVLADVAGRLQEIAEHELTGAAFTQEMLDFINQAVVVEPGCGDPFLTDPGWYGRLFFELGSALKADPTIADVHTQPTDEVGTPVGKVLHVGTGKCTPAAGTRIRRFRSSSQTWSGTSGSGWRWSSARWTCVSVPGRPSSKQPSAITTSSWPASSAQAVATSPSGGSPTSTRG